MPPAWVVWLPTSSFEGAMPHPFALRLSFQLTWSSSKRPKRFFTGLDTHRDILPPILFWLQPRIPALIDYWVFWFIFCRSKIWQLVIWLFSDPCGQMALSMLKLFRERGFTMFYTFSALFLTYPHFWWCKLFSEPRNLDIQWWKWMREAPNVWLARDHPPNPVWLDIQYNNL